MRIKALKLFLCLASVVLLPSCASDVYKSATRDDGVVISQKDKADNYFKIGVNALENNKLPKAFRVLFKADGYDNNNPLILDAIAYAYILRGDTDKVNEYYIRALRYDAPSSVYNNYSSFLISQKKYKKSIKYSTVAANDPTYDNSFMAYINLGDAYYYLNNQDSALKYYAKAIKIDQRAKSIVKNRMDSF